MRDDLPQGRALLCASVGLKPRDYAAVKALQHAGLNETAVAAIAVGA